MTMEIATVPTVAGMVFPREQTTAALMVLAGPIDRRPYETFIARHTTKKSRSTARDALAAWSRLAVGVEPDRFPWHLLEYEHVVRLWEFMLGQGLAPSTLNLRLSMLRSVVTECQRFGLMSPLVCANIHGVRGSKGNRLPRGRHVPASEIKAVLESATVRDRALLATLYGCGLRRAEAAAMTVEAIRPEGTLRIIGKGDKERAVPVPGGTMRALVRWLELRGSGPGPLFVCVDRAGNPILPHRQLSPASVSAQVKAVASRAGVPLTAHDFRRSFAGEMIDTVDILTVRALLGHASVSTTQIYDRRPERAMFEAAAKFHVPFIPG